jgi:hypothetical protein
MGKYYIAYIGLQLGPEKIFTKFSISLNVRTLNRDFTIIAIYIPPSE